MDIESFRNYCLSKKGATEYFPFDEETLVFRVGSKMFALTSIEKIPFRFNLKCEPEWAIELRETYPCITPGWHMNKKHWNTIEIDGSLSEKFIRKLIDHSYELVLKRLKKSERQEIEKL